MHTRRCAAVEIAVLATLISSASAGGADDLELTVVYGERRTVIPREDVRWFAPDDVRQLLLGIPPDAVDPHLNVRIAEQVMSAAVTEERGELVLTVDDGVRDRWKQKGVLDVIYRTGESRGQPVARLFAIPRQLDAKEIGTPVTIHQRRHKDVPGAHGFLRLEPGDITAGQVLVSVRDANGEAWSDAVAMREGDALSLKLTDAAYAVVLMDMVNLLTGEDYVTFAVRPLGEWQSDRIAQLLRAIESSDVVFIREGREYSGPEASDHLRRKLEQAGDKISSLDDFIEHIASRSSMTGNPYHVRLPDGTKIEAGVWMRKQTRTRLLPATG